MDYFSYCLVTECGSPIARHNGSIKAHQNTTEGAEISFMCNLGFVPAGRMRAVCGADGRWNPDPATLVCTSKYCILISFGCTLDNINGWTRNLKLPVFGTTVMKECCE